MDGKALGADDQVVRLRLAGYVERNQQGIDGNTRERPDGHPPHLALPGSRHNGHCRGHAGHRYPTFFSVELSWHYFVFRCYGVWVSGLNPAIGFDLINHLLSAIPWQTRNLNTITPKHIKKTHP